MGSLTINETTKKWNQLNNIMFHFYEHETVNQNTKDLSEECARDLEKYIHLKYPELDLEPYGSMESGFASKTSDVDFSLVLRRRCVMYVKEKTVLKNVAKVLNSAQATWKVKYIAASVPIVKLHWKGLEVDVSFQNTSALANTEILKQYAKWEPERLCVLGFWVKKWAQLFDIGSKTNETLSSYTYILMVIHFLQNHSPRVLPCLHSEFWNSGNGKKGKANYHRLVEANWSNNTETVAELFLGFLEFYSNYDFGRNMIHIRSRFGHTRRLKEIGAPIVVRDCVQRKTNIAAHVKQSTMNKIVDIIRLTRKDLSNWLDGKPVGDQRIKTLFNIQ